jgi:chromosome segregation ATPase
MSSDEIKLMLEQIKMILERLGHIETGIINLGRRMEAAENRLDRLEKAFRETIPLWAEELREEIRQGFERVNGEMRLLNKKIEVVHNDVLSMQAEQGLLESDVEDLKKKVS